MNELAQTIKGSLKDGIQLKNHQLEPLAIGYVNLIKYLRNRFKKWLSSEVETDKWTWSLTNIFPILPDKTQEMRAYDVSGHIATKTISELDLRK